jgi:hypothetical protein
MKLIVHLIKSLWATLKDPHLLSSKPHHGEWEDESIYDPNHPNNWGDNHDYKDI